MDHCRRDGWKGKEKTVQVDENNFKSFLVCFLLKYITIHNPFYNMLKLKPGKKSFLVISLPTEDVSFLYSRPVSAISKSSWHPCLPSHSYCKEGKAAVSDAQACTFETHTDAHTYVHTFQMSFQRQAENLTVIVCMCDLCSAKSELYTQTEGQQFQFKMTVDVINCLPCVFTLIHLHPLLIASYITAYNQLFLMLLSPVG